MLGSESRDSVQPKNYLNMLKLFDFHFTPEDEDNASHNRQHVAFFGRLFVHRIVIHLSISSQTFAIAQVILDVK